MGHAALGKRFFGPHKCKHLKQENENGPSTIKTRKQKKIALESPPVLNQEAHTFASRHEQLKWSRAWGIAEEFVTDGLGLAYTTCLRKYITDSFEA